MSGGVTRRGFVACGAALVAAAAAHATEGPSGRLAFEVTRNGSLIGSHVLVFSRAGGVLSVAIDARFRVGFGPITLYRYRHQGEEVWRDGQFESLTTETDDNGKQFAVRARRGAAGVAIAATGLGEQMAPAGALPLTHWAQAAMHAKLFNPETGVMLAETARPVGAGSVKLADGQSISATGYSLAGEAPIRDWYDSVGRWAALDAVGKDGSAIAYRRV